MSSELCYFPVSASIGLTPVSATDTFFWGLSFMLMKISHVLSRSVGYTVQCLPCHKQYEHHWHISPPLKNIKYSRVLKNAVVTNVTNMTDRFPKMSIEK